VSKAGGGYGKESRPVLAGPEKLIGTDPWQTGNWRDEALRDLYAKAGLPLDSANEDPAVGFEHVLRLWAPSPALPFPEWHEKHGENGSRMLYVSADCRRTRATLESVIPSEDDEPNPGGQASPRWEQQAGGLFAALRYACLSARSPSATPKLFEPDPRQRAIAGMLRKRDEKIARNEARVARGGIDRSSWMG
jgi:hypothetical protein